MEEAKAWASLKCSACRFNTPECEFIERGTVKETGDSPACSLLGPIQAHRLANARQDVEMRILAEPDSILSVRNPGGLSGQPLLL